MDTLKKLLTNTKLSDYQNQYTTPLIHDLMEAKTVTLLYAKSGVGKSFLALQLALAIATGDDFLGYKVNKSIPVLYLDSEMSAPTIHKRLSAHDVYGKLSDHQFKYVSSNEDCRLSLSTADLRIAFTDFIKESNYRFIVLDNLRTMFSIADENSSAEFNEINDFLLILRHIGCTVILIHHSTKAGDSYSGSTNIETVLDYAIGLHKVGNDRKLLVSKNRHDSGIDNLDNQHLSIVGNSFVLNHTSGIDMNFVAEEIIDAVKAGTISTQPELKLFVKNIGITGPTNAFTIPEVFRKLVQPYVTNPEFLTVGKFKAIHSSMSQQAQEPM